MIKIRNLSRRGFLKASAGATLIVGAELSSLSFVAQVQAAAKPTQPAIENFVKFGSDGWVTITSIRAEMGQGVRTGIPMILADELGADWARVKLWDAPGDESKYDPAGKDAQNTDGSRSTRHHFEVMRRIGASARWILEQAAAQQWGVDATEVEAKDHQLWHARTGRTLDFADVIEQAAGIELPEDFEPELKPASQWRYIGKDMPGVDNQAIVTGQAVYGADIRLPGMKIAVIARAPVYRGKIKSWDAAAALSIPGVDQVIELAALDDNKGAEFRALGGIAVIGESTWAVIQGRKALKLEWEKGPHGDFNSETFDQMLKESAKNGGLIVRNRGDALTKLELADNTVEASYFVPFLNHAPMEPPVALVDANVTPVQIITSTQSPNEARKYVAEALGIDKKDVACKVTLLGGSFGRKSKPDFCCEAALLSKAVGAPVRVQWTREDDVQHGYYHAASAHHLRGVLDKNGKVNAIRYSAAWPSILGLWVPNQNTGFPLEYGLGLVDMPYHSVPNIRIENGEANIPVRVGWYRSVNNIQHAFAMNCFVYELAKQANRDPLELMLEMIGDDEIMDLTADGVNDYGNYGDSITDWPIMPIRLNNALRKAAAHAGYGEALGEGEAIGLACHRAFHSYVATAVKVRVSGNSYQVLRVDTAIDCGRYVNPEGIRKQIEGAQVYGHTVAVHGRITAKDGAIEQSNFHNAQVSRMQHSPLDVRVHLIEDYVTHKPCGVGEPGVPPYAPALVNALAIATGNRIRELPIGVNL